MVGGGGFGASPGMDFVLKAPNTPKTLDNTLSAAEVDPDALDVWPLARLGKPEDIEINEDLAHKALKPTFLEAMKHSGYLLLCSLMAALGGFLFGYDTGIINGLAILPNFETTMSIAPDQRSSSERADLFSWIASSLVLACAFAAPFAGPLSEKIGRKWCIVLATIIVTCGACVQAGAVGWGMMIAGRVIVGLAIGLLSTVIPMYVSEMSPKSIRGTLGTLFQLMITIGLLVAFLVTLAFNKSSDTMNPENHDWRWALGTQAGLSIMLFFGMIFLPESPRWLIAQGKEQAARDVFARTRWSQAVGRRRVYAAAAPGTDAVLADNPDSPDTAKPIAGEYRWEDITNIDLEYLDVSEEVAFYDRLEDRSLFAYWKLLHPSVVLRTTMGMCLQWLQQLTGINAIFYYSSTIFLAIGLDTDIGTAVTGAVNVAATFIGVYGMDKFGRRTLLLCGAAGMFVCLVLEGVIVLCTDPATNSAAGNALIAFICLYIVNFAYGWGPIAWIIPAEVFPINVRAKGIAVATMSNWLANFAIAKSVPNMVLPENMGVGGTFLFFAGFAAVCWIYVATNIHETANITLEKMNQVFGIDTWSKYAVYVKHNFLYTFHWGGKSMHEYTDERSRRKLQSEIATDTIAATTPTNTSTRKDDMEV